MFLLSNGLHKTGKAGFRIHTDLLVVWYKIRSHDWSRLKIENDRKLVVDNILPTCVVNGV